MLRDLQHLAAARAEMRTHGALVAIPAHQRRIRDGKWRGHSQIFFLARDLPYHRVSRPPNTGTTMQQRRLGKTVTVTPKHKKSGWQLRRPTTCPTELKSTQGTDGKLCYRYAVK